jgi:16S rRNA (guanine(966)-N(2))-methyltransferase RsmD
MRVIAGTFRGRSLASPPGMTTRPITDRVKESLFSSLGARFGTLAELPAFDVLDIFSGTGGLGIEALSRGARSCVFVERDRRALKALNENIRKFRLETACKVLTCNAWSMRAPERPEGFGLIFIDPPYRDADDSMRVVDLIERLVPSLARDGVVVFRHDTHADFPVDAVRALCCVDQRKLRRMCLTMLVHPGQADAGSAADGGVDHVAGGEEVEEERGAEDVGDDADGELDDEE